jgi:hypothetical protein
MKRGDCDELEECNMYRSIFGGVLFKGKKVGLDVDGR